ncbi:conserved hypothetical protein [Mesorhizobium sp. STM 4661]|nr:conserved hypothetical protein [Mesorhizobium sp. STM 4661]
MVGGRGNIIGVLGGVLLLTVIQVGLAIISVPSFYVGMIGGYAADAEDMLFPLALGAQGSCQIGGNVATNAGGINVLRYGMTRDLVLGLEAVLPDGSLWEGMTGLRKDNRGYDLKQLLIGSEGTLGIVTGVEVKLFPRPANVETAYLGVGSFADAMARSAWRAACAPTF